MKQLSLSEGSCSPVLLATALPTLSTNACRTRYSHTTSKSP